MLLALYFILDCSSGKGGSLPSSNCHVLTQIQIHEYRKGNVFCWQLDEIPELGVVSVCPKFLFLVFLTIG